MFQVKETAIEISDSVKIVSKILRNLRQKNMLQFNRKNQRYLRGNRNKRQENAEGGENKGTIKEKWAKLKKTELDEMVKEKVKGKRKSVEYKKSWDKQNKENILKS